MDITQQSNVSVFTHSAHIYGHGSESLGAQVS